MKHVLPRLFSPTAPGVAVRLATAERTHTGSGEGGDTTSLFHDARAVSVRSRPRRRRYSKTLFLCAGVGIVTARFTRRGDGYFCTGCVRN